MKLPVFTTALFGALFAIAAYAADESAFKERQTAGEWRMATYLGAPIYSAAGEKMGDEALTRARLLRGRDCANVSSLRTIPPDARRRIIRRYD